MTTHLALVLALSLGAHPADGRPAPHPTDSERDRMASAPPLRMLCLGDSYTIGEGVPADSTWPAQLAVRLRGGPRDVAEPEIVARTGWTTDELEAGIAAAAPRGPYDLVTLLAGVNDQYRGRAPGEYRRHFRALLGRAIRFAVGEAGRVIVVSIPDWGVTAFAEGRDRAAIALEIDRFNGVARALAAEHHARWVDVTGVSRELGAWPAALAADGLHPSAAQYERWARLVAPVAGRALSAPRHP